MAGVKFGIILKRVASAEDDPMDGGPMDECLLTALPTEMLDKIMSYLSLPDVMVLRQSTSSFIGIATSYLIRKDLCAVKFTWNPDLNVYHHDKTVQLQGHKSLRRLDDLSACLDWLQQEDEGGRPVQNIFPCTHFQFTGGNLGSPDSTTFFSRHGPRLIRTLAIRFQRDRMTNKKTFFSILSHIDERLEALRIFNIHYLIMDPAEGGEEVADRDPDGEPKIKKSSSSSLLLPNLMSLSLGYNDMVANNRVLVTELLASAPNLELYEGPSCADDVKEVEVFESTQKIHTIKKFSFEPSSDNLEFYERLATHPNFGLKTLKIFPRQIRMRTEMAQERTTNALTKILEASKTSLRSMTMICPLIFIRGITWPKMKVLTELSINIRIYLTGFSPAASSTTENAMFEKWLDASNIFPSLSVLHFDGYSLWSDWQRSLSMTYFPFVPGSLNNVRRLCLQRNIPRLWLANFSTVFPNVQSLFWEEIKSFSDIGQFLWKIHSLRDIELQFNIGGDNHPVNSFPALDASFTGFSGEKCQSLMEEMGSTTWNEEDRVNPSILKLTRLTDLKITLRDMDEGIKESYALLSGPLTGQLAFKLMAPRLAVRFEIVTEKIENAQKMYDSLLPLAPYANIGLRPTSGLEDTRPISSLEDNKPISSFDEVQ